MQLTEATTITSRRVSSAAVAEWRSRSISSLIERVLLDVRVARRDVRLGLVVVVVADEVLDPVVGEELAHLLGQLGGEALVRGEDQRRPLRLLDRPGDRGRLARAGDAEQRLEAVAALDAFAERRRSPPAGRRRRRSRRRPGTAASCMAPARSTPNDRCPSDRRLTPSSDDRSRAGSLRSDVHQTSSTWRSRSARSPPLSTTRSAQRGAPRAADLLADPRPASSSVDARAASHEPLDGDLDGASTTTDAGDAAVARRPTRSSSGKSSTTTRSVARLGVDPPADLRPHRRVDDRVEVGQRAPSSSNTIAASAGPVERAVGA